MDFDKTFHITPEESQRQIANLYKNLTRDKSCCVCANSEKMSDSEMGYGIVTTWCRITGDYRDYECGDGCPNWKAKFPEYELSKEQEG